MIVHGMKNTEDIGNEPAVVPPPPGGSPPARAPRSPPVTPAWVKAFGLLGLLFVVGFVVLHVLGKGAGHLRHGHTESGFERRP